jgi:hypothetical protein
MMSAEEAAAHAELISQLCEGLVSAELSAALTDYTVESMYVLRHIPTKYFLEEDGHLFPVMAKELNEKGCIYLDRDGQPCCLTGNPSHYLEWKAKQT